MVNILIRNIPEKVIEKLDQQVAQLNTHREKKLSRNDYIKLIITNRVNNELENYQRTKYEILLQHQNDLAELEVELLKQILISFTTGKTTEAINLIENLPGLSDEKKERWYDH
ncbi:MULTISPECIES: hypothetical protein [unclassified Lactobacillus]|uniref:hypothetical protein n=1 Tax=unclassified Lactobacillus TaxID=2620435 RepID=UPI000EFA84F9|nr:MULTISPECIES: hypothetical protein [unclassified Lactobacillus]RMC38111.1 hypothetical protein F5ESL0237_07690 [Lactobacillus sp. ESL0237]RMC42636.1 hypothetical protein F5ESL0234_07555 [Lactobacillus sp. ESL0234]RMC43339.1 hypothetical protein F5ESL0236_07715 [Lactobacillus sp. ESL0236]RMC47848.1 hypothetical protein F5ESL0225_07905 [Lactobacillus sp. ESL0225]